MKYTLGISFLKLLIGFPLPTVFALMLDEIKSFRFKKTVQTFSYLPHFLSWVVLGGIMMTWLSDVGLINEILLGIGLLDEPIFWLAEPDKFWGIVVISDVWKELGRGAIIYEAMGTGPGDSLQRDAGADLPLHRQLRSVRRH